MSAQWSQSNCESSVLVCSIFGISRAFWWCKWNALRSDSIGFNSARLDWRGLVRSRHRVWKEQYPSVCFILAGDFDMRLLAIRANVSEYFVKPAETTLLVRKIHQSLKMSREAALEGVTGGWSTIYGGLFSSLLRSHGLMVKGLSSAEQVCLPLNSLNPICLSSIYTCQVNEAWTGKDDTPTG